MQYEPSKNDHGLPFNPFKSCCVPRPIGWISTTSVDGIDNLAPFSQFQNITFDPPMVLFIANQNTAGARKDTVTNPEQTGEFVWNMATWDLREAVNHSAINAEPPVDEFELCGLEKAKSMIVTPPRVAASPVHFECKYQQTVRIPGNGKMGTTDIVIGEVVMIHIADDVIASNGKIDIPKIRPIARLGYFDYTVVEKTFEMIIPEADEDVLRGLEGKGD